VIEIGPYRFSAMDARKTVDHFDELWQLHLDGRDPHALDGLRPTFTGDTDTDLRRAWDALLAAGPALRAAGQLPPRAVGTVEHLASSRGGVPKAGVDHVDVDHRGVVGDVQAARQHHGRPWQALCIWSVEVIDRFNRDGHALFAGAAGENVTVRDLPWADVRPGVNLRLGTVSCVVSAYALPCRKNAQWFAGRDHTLMHHERGPVSRVYATVLEPGSIAVGDPAILEP